MRTGKFNHRLYLGLLVISSALLAQMALAQEETNESQAAQINAAKVPNQSSWQPASWYQWLGPQRNGISPETGLFDDTPSFSEIWRVKAGPGFSGLSVVDGKAYTMYAKGQSEYAVCLNAATGEEIWATRTGGLFANSMGGDGPRATPTVVGDRVFTASAQSVLYALDAETGAIIWSQDLPSKIASARVSEYDWGYSASPLVEEGRVLIESGGKNNRSLAAFNAEDGSLLWTSGSDEMGYSSPIGIDFAGQRQAVFFTGEGLMAVAPQNGQVLWRHPWPTDHKINAATPVFVPPDKIFISTGYGVGGALVQLIADDERTTTVLVWKNKSMKNHFATSVYYQGHLYGFDESILVCLDATTGEEKWKTRGYGKGSLIIADGHLVILGEIGNLGIAEATPDAFRTKATRPVFDSKCWTNPSLADGRIYLRDEKEIVCLNINQ